VSCSGYKPASCGDVDENKHLVVIAREFKDAGRKNVREDQASLRIGILIPAGGQRACFAQQHSHRISDVGESGCWAASVITAALIKVELHRIGRERADNLPVSERSNAK